MDNRLKFRYHHDPIKTDGVTQEGRRSGQAVPVQAGRVAQARESRQGVPERRWGAKIPSSELADPMLPRKTSKEGHGARTANRHR